MKKSRILSAFIVGILLAAPTTALSYAAWRWLGTPFIPFDLFDRVSRILPGAVLTSFIEAMVAAIRVLDVGATAAVAKTVEQGLAVILFFAALVMAAVLFGLLYPRSGRRSAIFPATAFGLLFGLMLGLSVIHGQTARVESSIGFVWTVLLMAVWGAVLGWLHTTLPAPKPAPVSMAQADAIDRRQVLIRFGEASALITVSGALVALLPHAKTPEAGASAAGGQVRWSATHPLPNADDPVVPAPGTRPEFTPLESHYRIDINTAPPVINEESWKLHVTGLVENSKVFTLRDIRRFEPTHQFVTLACVSNPVGGDLIGTTRWTGVSLQSILNDVQPRPTATHLKISAADGFFETVAIQTIRNDSRVMLTYEWDGLPLTSEHGYPLRIYIPDRYGMKQPKWIRSIELIDHPEDGYWVERGWDAEARMRATSVIDTRDINRMIAGQNTGSLIPLGGIAHAGARGISRVQVKVNQQPWQDATLRKPMSGTTWVLWRYDWPFEPGRHMMTVRCFEGDGTPQITANSPPHPSGATGLHSI